MSLTYRVAGYLLLVALLSSAVQAGLVVSQDRIYNLTQDNNSTFLTGSTLGDGPNAQKIVQITNRSTDQLYPVVSNSSLVWLDTEGGGNFSLYLYDIANGSEKKIVGDIYSLMDPEISENWVAWVAWVEWRDVGASLPNIYLYNSSNDTTKQLTEYPSVPLQTDLSQGSGFLHSTLAVSGDRIVWHDRRNGNMDIYLIDLSTGIERQITGSPVDQVSPSTWGDYVVWAEMNDPEMKNDIFLYNLTSGNQTQITNDLAIQEAPEIEGNNIVWTELNNGNCDIVRYNITSGSTSRITDDPAEQVQPRLSGDLVAWEDNRSGNLDVYVYNLSSGVEKQITNDTFDQIGVEIDGDIVTWTDDRNGNYDIYLCSLSNNSFNNSQNISVEIDSVPQGAEVFVDGERKGTTPSVLYFDRPGNYSFELQKEGFRPYTITLDASEPIAHTAMLELYETEGYRPGIPIHPRIAVDVDSVPQGANVSIDGEDRGLTPTTVHDIPKDHVLEISLEGYQIYQEIVNTTGQVNVTLVPEVATEMSGPGFI